MFPTKKAPSADSVQLGLAFSQKVTCAQNMRL
jgi:hypothetical protein